MKPCRALNLLLLVVGLAIVWDATHNWTAIFGAFVASIHVSVRSRGWE